MRGAPRLGVLMATTEIAVHGSATSADRQPVVNDFIIQVATVNGSGSQSANTVLLRSIFQMGVPVSGKNLFPSNIAGLPTWYTIRASKKGYIARKKEIDFVVAMNPETGREDCLALAPGSALLYDEPLKLSELRSDLIFYSVPFDKLVAAVCPEAKLRKLVKNMIYVGVMAHLLNIDMAEVEKALRKQFAKKVKAADLNGNSAAAMGCMFAGVTVVTWYPITPSSSLVESLIDYMKAYRIGPDGKATFAIVQAEDELAAVGMVLGAGWAGARSMTATAGPGISLMAEFTGLGYYVEVPGVIWDIQRVGPSTGLPTRTSQGDIEFVAKLSHGDTFHPMLIPSTVSECFSMATEAFNLAEHLQTPVFVMSDLDLGMNNWMSEPFAYPKEPIKRGKILKKEDLDRLGGFNRYKDVDGDGIGYRTLPGIDHPQGAWFARGSGHNEKGQYSERPDDYKNNLDRLRRKFENARTLVPKPEVVRDESNDIGIIAYGTSHHALVEALDQLKDDHGVHADYLRLRAFPFTPEVHDFIASHPRVYVIDQNRDGQMLNLLKLDIAAEHVVRLRSVRHYNGLPIDGRSVTDDIISQESK